MIKRLLLSAVIVASLAGGMLFLPQDGSSQQSIQVHDESNNVDGGVR